MTVTRPAADVVSLAPDILAGKVRGRVWCWSWGEGVIWCQTLRV